MQVELGVVLSHNTVKIPTTTFLLLGIKLVFSVSLVLVPFWTLDSFLRPLFILLRIKLTRAYIPLFSPFSVKHY